jgi:hypothetical protein
MWFILFYGVLTPFSTICYGKAYTYVFTLHRFIKYTVCSMIRLLHAEWAFCGSCLYFNLKIKLHFPRVHQGSPFLVKVRNVLHNKTQPLNRHLHTYRNIQHVHIRCITRTTVLHLSWVSLSRAILITNKKYNKNTLLITREFRLVPGFIVIVIYTVHHVLPL